MSCGRLKPEGYISRVVAPLRRPLARREPPAGHPERFLGDGQLFGMLFESLAIHDLGVYARALPGAPAEPLSYYRDSDGLEVDAVIGLRDGRWAPIEVKLGENKAPEAFASIARLRGKNLLALRRSVPFRLRKQEKGTSVLVIPVDRSFKNPCDQGLRRQRQEWEQLGGHPQAKAPQEAQWWATALGAPPLALSASFA